MKQLYFPKQKERVKKGRLYFYEFFNICLNRRQLESPIFVLIQSVAMSYIMQCLENPTVHLRESESEHTNNILLRR